MCLSVGVEVLNVVGVCWLRFGLGWVNGLLAWGARGRSDERYVWVLMSSDVCKGAVDAAARGSRVTLGQFGVG